MSLEDVCELGNMLYRKDEENDGFLKRLHELDSGVQTQDRRLNQEVDAEYSARNVQGEILEFAQKINENFEFYSSIISQLQSEVISTSNLSTILTEIENYIIEKEILEKNVQKTNKKIDSLNDSTVSLDGFKAQEIPKNIAGSQKQKVNDKVLENKMRKQISDVQIDIGHVTRTITEELNFSTSEISKTLPSSEQNRGLLDDKTKDLDKKASRERCEANNMTASLSKAKDSSFARVTEFASCRDKIVFQINETVDATARDEARLLSYQDENRALTSELNRSSEAEQTTLRGLEECKKELNELEKFSSDNCDELNRIRKALTFEQAREQTFVKSHSDYTGSAQLICNDVEVLISSLQLVRDEIKLIKQQLILGTAEAGEGLEGVEHEELQYLLAEESTLIADANAIIATVADISCRVKELDDNHVKMETEEGYFGEQRGGLEVTRDTLLKEDEVNVERLGMLSLESEAYLSVDHETAFASLSEEDIQLTKALREEGENEEKVNEDDIQITAALSSHTQRENLHNVERDTQCEQANKETRLKAMKKHKEIECKTMVKELKDELKNEDRILKEAVKAAEDMARKTEEKLTTSLEKMKQAGRQTKADLEQNDQFITAINNELSVLPIVPQKKLSSSKPIKQRVSLSQSVPTVYSKSVSFNTTTSTIMVESTEENVEEKGNEQEKGTEEEKGTDTSSYQLDTHQSPNTDSWHSSCPATNLPKDQTDSLDQDSLQDITSKKTVVQGKVKPAGGGGTRTSGARMRASETASTLPTIPLSQRESSDSILGQRVQGRLRSQVERNTKAYKK